jgi:ABC-type uncharacterized transport system permease subunit
VWLAWFLHGILLGWGLWGNEPRFGFAPALSVTAWLVGLVYAIEGHFFPQLKTPWLLSGAGAAAVLLALLFPGTPLNTSASTWLPLHWVLGIASYGLFTVAVVHAWLMTRAEARIRVAADAHTGMPLLTMERLTFRFVSVGFALLTATLLAGFFFGNYLYGANHAIKWDHKTAFSVLSWLTFSVLVVGRVRFGWRGKRAVRVLYAGAGLLLLAYVGSRFVMEVILGHTL